MMGNCARCGQAKVGKVPIVSAGSQPPAFVCLDCESTVAVPYVGGPLNGGHTSFPRDVLVVDGAYEERPIPTGADEAERYVLRRTDGGWALVHAGPVD